MNENPKLRFVEAFPVASKNGPMFALRDPSGLIDEVVMVTEQALFLMQFFDGHHSALDIRAEYYRHYGAFLPEQKLQHLIEELDHHHLLENQSFREYKRALETQWLQLPARPAAHAGVSYSAEAQQLREELDRYYATGAGQPKTPSDAVHEQHGETITGAIAPHIDLRVGGPCYTHTYRALAESTAADIYVILGTGHSGLANCYSCLPMDFETPLGLLKHDAEMIAELNDRLQSDIFEDPLPHRTEHTIEFQTLFLQHLLGEQHEFTIVPILCSYAYPMLTEERFERERRIIETFVEALRDTVANMSAKGKRICTLASVDFSHVGPRYGDRNVPDADLLQLVRDADHQLIDAITNVDATRFVSVAERLGDRYRVCGFAPIHTLLATTTACFFSKPGS